MNRRFFKRVDVHANGELIWATKSRFGRVTTHRVFVMTENVSVDGARILLPGSYDFPIMSRARLKLGLEFSEVEVLDCVRTRAGRTALRLTFITPSHRFIEVVERWIPVATAQREVFGASWAGRTAPG